MTGRVVVVDYGIGNVFSVCNALRTIGADVTLTRAAAEIRGADRLILPGVGAFARAMEALDGFGLSDRVREFVATERPFLGICVGMQMLMDRSTEFGDHPGLGLISGAVERLESANDRGERVRVPHIGWSSLSFTDRAADTPLVSAGRDAVYFVHSYHCKPADPVNVLATTSYSGLEVTAAIGRDNIVGVQFHPERSGPVGRRVLEAFVHDRHRSI